MFLLPPSLDDFIDEGHPVHLINDLVEQLDLSGLEKRYGAMGQPAYAPRMIVKVILYGYSVGLLSSRKWMQACQENLAFKFLAGMEQPSYKTFIEFLQRHREDLPVLFYETVKLARAMGVVHFGNIALDGTKIKANSSKHKAMSYGRMIEEEKRLKEEIKVLLEKTEQTNVAEDQIYGADNDGYHLQKELSLREERLKKIEVAKLALEEREKKDHPDQNIDPKKQISFADPQARPFAKKSEGAAYVYNAQAAVDMESQIIVENHIEDSVSDAGAVQATLENMAGGVGEKPEHLVADAGYGNSKTVEACSAHGVTPVCATSRDEGSGSDRGVDSQGLNSFVHDDCANTFECSHGSIFGFDHWTEDGRYAVYRNCGDKICSCGGAALTAGGRTLRVRKSHLAQRKLQRIMESQRQLYQQRKSTIEPVFGQIKSVMGFRQFLRRGLQNVGAEWNIVCAAFNLKKIATLIAQGFNIKPTPIATQQILEQRQAMDYPFSVGIIRYVHLFKLFMDRFKFDIASLGVYT
jgi:transposase